MVSVSGVPCELSFWNSVGSNCVMIKDDATTSRGGVTDYCEWLLTPLGNTYQIDVHTMAEDAAFADLVVRKPGVVDTAIKVVLLSTIIPLVLALAVRAYDRLNFNYYDFGHLSAHMNRSELRIPPSVDASSSQYVTKPELIFKV